MIIGSETTYTSGDDDIVLVGTSTAAVEISTVPFCVDKFWFLDITPRAEGTKPHTSAQIQDWLISDPASIIAEIE